MDADLDALVDHVSPGRPVILIGHSWGGMYATLYINRHPEKVAGAVLMEPGPLNGAMFDAIIGDLYDLDVFSEWLNDDVWDGQFLTPDDHARADYHRMLGMRDSQPKFHQSDVESGAGLAAGRGREPLRDERGHEGRQGGLRLHRSPGRVFDARAVHRQRQERGHRRRVSGAAAAVLSRPRIW